MRLWSPGYLSKHPAGQQLVSVEVTPNGRADACTQVGAGRALPELHTPALTCDRARRL
jgi:hypothetical protein